MQDYIDWKIGMLDELRGQLKACRETLALLDQWAEADRDAEYWQMRRGVTKDIRVLGNEVRYIQRLRKRQADA